VFIHGCSPQDTVFDDARVCATNATIRDLAAALALAFLKTLGFPSLILSNF
jgi:hypothetical protein